MVRGPWSVVAAGGGGDRDRAWGCRGKWQALSTCTCPSPSKCGCYGGTASSASWSREPRSSLEGSACASAASVDVWACTGMGICKALAHAASYALSTKYSASRREVTLSQQCFALSLQQSHAPPWSCTNLLRTSSSTTNLSVANVTMNC